MLGRLFGPVGNRVSGPLVNGSVAVCPNFNCRAVLGVMPSIETIADRVVEKLKKAR